MSQAATADWVTNNQRELMAEVAAVRAQILGTATEIPPTTSGSDDNPSALDAVSACFELSPFERQIVVLCAAPELDGSFAHVLADAQGDPARGFPTFGLALAALPDAHWSAIAPTSPLRAWRLIELGSGPLTAAPLHIDEWLLHVLAGAGGLDQRLAPIVELLTTTTGVPASGEHAVAALTAAWLPGPCPPVQLRGPAGAPKQAVFIESCARLNLLPCLLRAADVPTAAGERDDLLRLWQREALLHQAALLIEGQTSDDLGLKGALDRFTDRLSTPAAVATSDGERLGTRAMMMIEVAKPTATEQRGLWAAALGPTNSAAALNGALDRVVAQFDLDATGISAAATLALAAGEPTADAAARLWDACRHSSRGGLDDLAQRLDTTATFDDLVLPDLQLQLLHDLLAHVRQRSRVYDEWQMAGPSRRGLGISALFAGPSGTGKTLAAEVLANSLELDLYRIDLSQVVSKYIGETEKNLRRVFDAADHSGAVLLFDEADALFGKRSEVRDSHDRYANVEISFLLQAMESYRGLAVLTTNMRNAIDPAFLRRLRFVISFPFPGTDERYRIWLRAFPPATPTHELDAAKLAQLSVAGGNIRSIALHASFFAAEAGVAVGMQELLRAAVAEYAKLERSLSDAEIEGWL
jgi:hypothetical protein